MTADHAAAREPREILATGAAWVTETELESLVFALERVTEERDGWQSVAQDADGVLYVKRAESAEAWLVEARRALEQIANAPIGEWLSKFREIARAALAATKETKP